MDTKNIDAATPDEKPAEGAETPIMCAVRADKAQSMHDNICKPGGMIAKAQAAKHLSDLLMGEIQLLLGDSKGEKARNGARKFIIYESTLETLTWLAAEVWEVSGNLAGQVDDLDADFCEFANAAYYATHDETGKPIAAEKARTS